ncbi:cadherin domain-containing protein [Caulobacter sp.]|uniref:cadherin domain-containing protein n=1 Tax=Caulobacter sp. TaxID=78 RepID=UPI003BB0C7CC
MTAPYQPTGRMNLTGEVIAGYQRDHTIPKEIFLKSGSNFVKQFLALGDEGREIFDFDSKADNIQQQPTNSLLGDAPHNGSHPAKTQAVLDILNQKYESDYRFIFENPDVTPEQKNQIRREMGEFLKKTANEVQFKSSAWVDSNRQLINSATNFDPATKKYVPVSKLVASPEWQSANAAQRANPVEIAKQYNARILSQPLNSAEVKDFKILSDLGGGRTIALTPGDPDAVKNLRAIAAEAKSLGVPDDANFYDKIKAVDQSLGVDNLVEQTHTLTDQIKTAPIADRAQLIAQRDELIRQTESKINARSIGAAGAEVEYRKVGATLRNVVGDLAERGLLRKAGQWAAGEGAEFLVKRILPKLIPGLNVVSTALDIYDAAMFAYEIYKRRDEIAAFARRIGAEFASVAHAEDGEGGAVEVTTVKLPNEVDEIVVIARRAPGTNVFQVLGAYAMGTFRSMASALGQATGMTFRLKPGALAVGGGGFVGGSGFEGVSLAPNGGYSKTTTATYDRGRVTHSEQVVQSAESILGHIRSTLDADYEIRQGLYFNLNSEESYDQDGALEETRTDVSAVEYEKDADGRLVAETQRSRFTAAQFGSILGSNISNLLKIHDPWLKLSVGTVLGTIGSTLGDALEHGGTRQAFSDAFEGFPGNLKDAGLGAVSSYLFGELVAEIGLEGLPAQVTTTVGGAAISTIAVNLANGRSWNHDLGPNVLNAAGAFVGTWLASQLISFDSVGGQLGSTFGSAIGATFVVAQFVVAATATSSATLFGAEIGALAGPLGAAIGAFAGFIIGGLVGSLFGGKPKAGAELGWNAAEGRYGVTSVWSKNGGSKDGMAAMAMSVAGTLNTVIAASGSIIMDPASVRLGSYSSKGKDFRYSTVGAGISYTTRDPEALIAYGSSIALGDLVSRLAGGDVLTKRAVLATLEAGSGFDAAALYGNLATARSYGEFLANRDLITPLMESDPESVFASGWTITVAQALALGLDRRASTDWIGGWTLFLDETFGGKVDGLAYAPTALNFQLSEKNERVFIFVTEAGEVAGAFGDTIDSAGKLKVDGSALADFIQVTGRTLTSTGGLTIGAGSSTTALDIQVTAVIEAGDGNDVVRAGDLGNDVLGGVGNDRLVGGKLDDWLFGEDGDDMLFAGDVVSAGIVPTGMINAFPNIQNPDFELVVDAAAAVTVNGGNGDLLDGGEGNDRLYGGTGSDWLKGGDGVDLLVGGAGGDILEGGAGDDQQADGSAAVLGGAGTDQYVFGYGDGNDVLFDESDPAGVAGAAGDSFYNRISQLNAGTLTRNWAGNGNYEVDGSVKGGEDAVVFGVGVTMRNLSMRRSGVNGQDLVIQLTAENSAGAQVLTGDSLTIKDWFESTRKVEWLRFANGDEIRIGDITSYIVGVAGQSVIIGSYGADWIVGTDGADQIYGLNGDDFGFGGLGADLVSGDANNDLVSGGGGDDIVIGGAGNDTVLGDGGRDNLSGGAGYDILAGGKGADTITAGAGDDVIRYARGDGQDVLIDDLVDNWDRVWVDGAYVDGYHLGENGTVVKTTGNIQDTTTTVYFDGSNWINGADYDYDATARVLRRHKGALGGVIGVNAGTDILEFAVGIDIQDLLLRRVGNDLEITVSDVDATGGFAGANDKITIRDWWSAATGAELRPIEKFSFLATGTALMSDYTVVGGATDGADTLTAAATSSWITGGAGDDILNGGVGQDILTGGDGADKLLGGAANDYLYGGVGDDSLDGGAGADLMFGGAGTDLVSYASNSTSGVRAYLGAAFANSGNGIGDVYSGMEGIEGSQGSDRLGGDAADNILRGGLGNDNLLGGAGGDTYEFNRGDGADSIREGVLTLEEILDKNGVLNTDFAAAWQLMRLGAATGVTGVYYQYQLTVTRLADGEVVYQSRDGVDFLYATDQAAQPAGGSWPYSSGQWKTGANRSGNGVQTVLERITAGDGGADTLAMGSTISLSNLIATRGTNYLNLSLDGSESVTLYDQAIADRAVETLQLADGLVADLTKLRLAGEAATVDGDFMLGNTGNNVLSGLAGDDVISGGAGDDTLDGGGGNDILEGGTGADTLNGGTDSQTDGLSINASDPSSYGDTIRYVSSVAGVAIDLAAQTASGGDAQGDVILAVAGVSTIENVVGSDAYGDQINGDNRLNRLFGLGGNDVLDGRAGDDVLVGGAGDDILYGGDGDDALAGEDGGDRLEGGAGKDLLSGGAGNDEVLGGVGDDQLTGDDGDDRLYGGDGLDTLGGGEGADLLQGEAGDDKLVGGAGNDQLFGGDGNDLLVGEAGNDMLDGGAGDDTFGFDANSGADWIIDAAGANRVVIGGVASDRIWLTRSGEDLRIAVIGGTTAITVSGFYAASGARMKEIALDGASLFLGHAQALIDAMTAVSFAPPAVMPAAIAAQAAPSWHVGGKAVPVVAGQTLVTDEDVAIVGQVGAVDDDDNVTGYAVVGAPTFGTLQLNAVTGAWVYTPNANAHGAEHFVLSVSDADGHVVQQTVALTVVSINDAPDSLTGPAVLEIDENSPDGVFLGQFASTDPDGPGETATYTLSNDAGARFEITPAGQLKVKNGAALNYEAGSSHVVRIRVTDGAGAWLEKDFTVAVLNVNETPNLPVLSAQPITLASENAGGAGAALGDMTIATFNLTDPDNTTPTVRIVSDPRGWLQTVGNAVQFKTGLELDFEALAAGASLVDTDGDGIKEFVYSFKVEAWDGVLGSASQLALTVNIEDANEAPTNIVFAPTVDSVAERDRPMSGASLPAISLGTLSASDPDTTPGSGFAAFSYSVADSRFEIVNGNELRLKAGAALDYEAGNTVNLSITVKDLAGAAGALSFTKVFSLNVTNQDDYSYGDASNNGMMGQANRDVMYGQGGNDTIRGGAGDDDLFGGDGADTLTGADGVDRLEGGLGADGLDGGSGADLLLGGDGDDNAAGGGGNDALYGESGADILNGGDGEDLVDGGDGNDLVQGGAGNDILRGGDGDDILEGMSGADHLLGGAGFDTLSYTAAATGVTLSLAAGGGTGGNAFGDVFEDTFDKVIGSNHADSITGSNGADILEGGGGNDTLLGGAGNDQLFGGDGDDYLDAQSGNDVLVGGAGADILVGGDDSDTYLIDINSGADEIREYDSNGDDIDVIGYQDIDRSQLWFQRTGNSLTISVIGTSVATTIKDWYVDPSVSASDRANYKIDFILAGLHVSDTINAEGLVSLMAGYAKPATQTDYDALHQDLAFENQWKNHWDANGEPVVSTIANQVVNEDGTLTVSFTATDDISPVTGLTVIARAVNPNNYALEDLSLVNPPTVSAPDANGVRTITLTAKANTSGAVAIKLQVTDPGGLLTERIFRLDIAPVADVPTVTVAAPLSTTLDSGSLALDIQAALVDQDGSEILEIRIANIPTGLTLNKGTNLGGGVWSLTAAQLSGLALVGPTGWSTDLTGAAALSVTAISREQATGATATSPVTVLNVPINARPTGLSADRTITVNETTAESQVANGTLLAQFSRTDADNDTPTYSLVDIGGGAGAGGRFAINAATGALTLANANLLNFEAAASHLIRVRITDTGGLTYDKDFTVNVANLNERPTVPTVSLSTRIFSEGVSANTLIASYSATDPDGGAPGFLETLDPWDWLYLSGAQLYRRAGVSIDFEALKALGTDSGRQITDIDGDGRQEVALAVDVAARDTTFPDDPSKNSAPVRLWYYIEDANDAPTDILADRALSMAENTAPGAIVGVFSSVDQDVGDGAKFSLVNNTSPFALSENGSTLIVTGPLNYEAATSYTITVHVTDTAGAGYDKLFTVGVTNVNEAPTVSAATFSISEFAAPNSPVGSVPYSDPDAPDSYDASLQFSLSGAGSEKFSINNVGQISYRGGSIDYETQPHAYNLTVVARDQNGNGLSSLARAVTINVEDKNDTPIVTVNLEGDGKIHVAESLSDTGPGKLVGTFTVKDSDAGQSWGVSLDGAPGLFVASLTGARDAAGNLMGEIRLHGNLDYEARTSYAVTLNAWDSAGAYAAPVPITISVDNVDEAPVLTGFYNYNFDVYTVIALIASDPEGSQAIYWSISDVVGNYFSTQSNDAPVGYWSGPSWYLTFDIAINGYWQGAWENISMDWQFTLNISDAGGHISSKRYAIQNSTLYSLPIVLDLDGDGEIITAFAESRVFFDQNGDGVRDLTGWSNAGDGLLALDRNHNGQIDDGSEISFVADLEGAVSDLEGLRAYDTNGNGLFDSQDAQFSAFQVWRDANQDGVSQADELFSLADLDITAIDLTSTPTVETDANPADNRILGTTQFIRGDGTTGQVGDVMFAYQGAPEITLIDATPDTSNLAPPTTGLLPPVVIDLDGDGLELISRADSTVRFDVAGDGQAVRIGWVGADDAFLALDRDGDGKITNGAEISFTSDLAGAVSDLEGLQAFDSNANGFLDARDERFGEFRIWQDRNQDGVSQTDELHGLAELGFQAFNLTRQLTGASLASIGENVLYGTSDLVKTDGSRLVVGDIMLAFGDQPDAERDDAGYDDGDRLDAIDRTAASASRPPKSTVSGFDGDGRAPAARSKIDPPTAAIDDAMLAPLTPRSWSQIDLAGILDAARMPSSELGAIDYDAMIAGASPSALDNNLALAQQTRLRMIQAMAGFSREGAADLGPDAWRQGHAQSLALLTALPDVRAR